MSYFISLSKWISAQVDIDESQVPKQRCPTSVSVKTCLPEQAGMNMSVAHGPERTVQRVQ